MITEGIKEVRRVTRPAPRTSTEARSFPFAVVKTLPKPEDNKKSVYGEDAIKKAFLNEETIVVNVLRTTHGGPIELIYGGETSVPPETDTEESATLPSYLVREAKTKIWLKSPENATATRTSLEELQSRFAKY